MNKLSRRDFGKWLSLAGISLAIPVSVIQAKVKNPDILNVKIETLYTMPTEYECGMRDIYSLSPPLTTVEITYDNGCIYTYQTFDTVKTNISITKSNGRVICDVTQARLTQDDTGDNNNLTKHTLTINAKPYLITLKSLKLASITYPTVSGKVQKGLSS